MKFVDIILCSCLYFHLSLGHLLGSEVQELLKSSDKVCNDNVYTSGTWVYRLGRLNKFTGIRVFKVFSLRVRPFQKSESVRVIYCDNGRNMFEEDRVIDTDHAAEAIWRNPFVFNVDSRNLTFQFSRKEGYIDHDHSFALPGSLVGGVFHCFDEICSQETSHPVLPLYSSTHKKVWLELLHGEQNANWTFEKYIPLLSTPNDGANQVPRLKQLFTGSKKSRSPKSVLVNLLRQKGYPDNVADPLDEWSNYINVDENYFYNI